MTFRDYYRALGFFAFFASRREAYDREQRLLNELARKDELIEFHRRKLTDAMMVTANRKPVYDVPETKVEEYKDPVVGYQRMQ